MLTEYMICHIAEPSNFSQHCTMWRLLLWMYSQVFSGDDLTSKGNDCTGRQELFSSQSFEFMKYNTKPRSMQYLIKKAWEQVCRVIFIKGISYSRRTNAERDKASAAADISTFWIAQFGFLSSYVFFLFSDSAPFTFICITAFIWYLIVLCGDPSLPTLSVFSSATASSKLEASTTEFEKYAHKKKVEEIARDHHRKLVGTTENLWVGTQVPRYILVKTFPRNAEIRVTNCISWIFRIRGF